MSSLKTVAIRVTGNECLYFLFSLEPKWGQREGPSREWGHAPLVTPLSAALVRTPQSITGNDN